jgi:SAM-dependent methyltransferase
MFDELPEFLKEIPTPKIALDLGCGFGIAACAMLEWFPPLKMYGVEPSAARVRAATQVISDRGKVFRAAAPDFELPGLPLRFDLILMLDMAHFLSDDAFDLTLRRARARLAPDGWLLLRAPMLPQGAGSIKWKLDRLRRLFTGEQAHYRNVQQIQTALIRAGFEITKAQLSGNSPELFWFIARDSAQVIADSPIQRATATR